MRSSFQPPAWRIATVPIPTAGMSWAAPTRRGVARRVPGIGQQGTLPFGPTPLPHHQLAPRLGQTGDRELGDDVDLGGRQALTLAQNGAPRPALAVADADRAIALHPGEQGPFAKPAAGQPVAHQLGPAWTQEAEILLRLQIGLGRSQRDRSHAVVQEFQIFDIQGDRLGATGQGVVGHRQQRLVTQPGQVVWQDLDHRLDLGPAQRGRLHLTSAAPCAGLEGVAHHGGLLGRARRGAGAGC
jgi:hypothetical protein